MSEPSNRKPTPVRQTLAGDSTAEGTRFASLRFEAEDGELWLVEELGWTRSGRREDPGTPLLLLGFRREGEDEYDREALVAAHRLNDLSESLLPDLLGSAGAFRGSAPERSFFAATRSRTRETRGRRRDRPQG